MTKLRNTLFAVIILIAIALVVRNAARFNSFPVVDAASPSHTAVYAFRYAPPSSPSLDMSDYKKVCPEGWVHVDPSTYIDNGTTRNKGIREHHCEKPGVLYGAVDYAKLVKVRATKAIIPTTTIVTVDVPVTVTPTPPTETPVVVVVTPEPTQPPVEEETCESGNPGNLKCVGNAGEDPNGAGTMDNDNAGGNGNGQHGNQGEGGNNNK